jgi:hypothetical protein
MYLADFNYTITYIHGELNMAADTLSCMLNVAPDACLTACAMAYAQHAPTSTAVGILNITTDQSLLDVIITGYKTDDFTKQLTKDISMGSIEGATLTDKLLYVRH